MKKVFVVLALSLFSIGVFAQSPQKGKVYIGTSVMGFWGANENGSLQSTQFSTGFNYSKVKDGGSSTVIGLAPEIGYFISDKWSIGLGVAYNHISFKEDDDSDALKLNSFGINPYARYYACTVDKFSFYMQGGFHFSTSKVDIDGAESLNNIGINIRPGVSYNLSDKFALNATFGNLGWNNYKQGDAKLNEFGIDLNMSSLLFGITISL